MSRYLLHTLTRFALLMLAICLVTFALIGLSPIDPVQSNVGQAAYLSMSEAKRAQLAAYWSVDTPLWERFCSWASGALHGDFGMSLRFNAPVGQVIANRALNSALLLASAWIISGILGFALGVLAGVKRGTAADRIIKAYCYVLAATPTFWLALVMLVVFSVMLGWFPIGFSVPIGANAADVSLSDLLHHLTLPALTLSLVGVANIALHTREKTIDVMESSYVRFARSRGQSTWQAVRHHGLRNLALPAITLQCASISEIFGGSVLVEQVFSYPGLGQAAVTAGLGGDAPLLLGIALVSAALVFGGNLLANILYGVIDPRMKTSFALRRPSKRQQAKANPQEEKPAQAELSLEKLVQTNSANKEQTKAELRNTSPQARTSFASAPAASAFAQNPAPAAPSEPAPSKPQSALSPNSDTSLVLALPRRTKRGNRRILLAAAVVSVTLLLGIVMGGLLAAPTASVTDLSLKNQAPSWQHLLGTDALGRDMLLRTLAGLSTSVLVGLLAAGASSLIALVLGTVAALGGRKADAFVSWLIDLVMGLPHLVLLILISYALGKGFWGVVIGVALTHWPSLARIVRAEVLQVKEAPFVSVARKLGRSRWQIARDHLLPAVLPQFLIGLILLFPHAILHEAAITFLGFGLPPEQAAIGIILSESMSYLSAGMWWLALFPGLALVGVVLLFDATGGSLRKLFDPHSNQD